MENSEKKVVGGKIEISISGCNKEELEKVADQIESLTESNNLDSFMQVTKYVTSK